jgi:hypothetical protein
MPCEGLEMNRPTKPEPKESYSTPKLTIYGTIEQLTEAVGMRGSTDGGNPPTNRTQV